MDSEGMGEIVVRIRHKILQCREAEKRLQDALLALEGPRSGEEPKALDAGTVDAVMRESVDEAVAEIARIVKPKKKGGLMAKIRQGVAKIGPATTGDITAWLHKNGFPDARSSTVSALLWEGRKRKEFSKDSAARWTYTGGL